MNELITELNNLSGLWINQKENYFIEEYWSELIFNQMSGCFRMFKDGELVFQEYMNIVISEEDTILKIKHFDKTMSGWEEKEECVKFKLESYRNKIFCFEQIDKLDTILNYKLSVEKLEVELIKEGECRSKFEFIKKMS